MGWAWWFATFGMTILAYIYGDDEFLCVMAHLALVPTMGCFICAVWWGSRVGLYLIGVPTLAIFLYWRAGWLQNYGFHVSLPLEKADYTVDKVREILLSKMSSDPAATITNVIGIANGIKQS